MSRWCRRLFNQHAALDAHGLLGSLPLHGTTATTGNHWRERAPTSNGTSQLGRTLSVAGVLDHLARRNQLSERRPWKPTAHRRPRSAQLADFGDRKANGGTRHRTLKGRPTSNSLFERRTQPSQTNRQASATDTRPQVFRKCNVRQHVFLATELGSASGVTPSMCACARRPTVALHLSQTFGQPLAWAWA